MSDEMARFIPVTVLKSTHDLLIQQGYNLIDDVWSLQGRRTYDHNDEATREFITCLVKFLRSAGWEGDLDKLRSFRHPVNSEIIEIEPGGSDTTGHFLHHMKTFD
jgi:hypothetical protein